MKIEIKAAIYSGIVFPGSGYFFTKEKIRGFICIFTCLVTLFMLMRDAWVKAQIIANDIVLGGAPLDMNTIREKINAIPSLYSENVVIFIYSTLCCIWLISIIDSYRLAKKENC